MQSAESLELDNVNMRTYVQAAAKVDKSINLSFRGMY